MKSTTYAFAAAALAHLAVAVPHSHHKRHQNLAERDVVVWETVYAPDVVVYVDGNGNTIRVEGGAAAPTAASAPTPAPVAPVHVEAKPTVAVPVPEPAKPAPVAPVAPAPAQPAPAAPEVAKPAPPPPAVASPPAPPAVVDDNVPQNANARYASEAAGVSKANGYGISWTPFDGPENAAVCKTQDQANAEFKKMARLHFTNVRIYGNSCNQVEIAMKAAAQAGVNLMLGVWDIHNVAAESQDIVRQVERSGVGWGIVHTLSVGNEDVQKGQASPGDIMSAVGAARDIFRGAGFQGAIVHVDTMAAILANPELCKEAAGDFVAANIHPFFNDHTPAIFAGRFVAEQVGALRACSVTQNRKRANHRVIVTETGWPTAGETNGRAIPGRLHQFAAIASIKRHVPHDVYLYSAFNNNWLPNHPGTFNAEHFWGLLDN